MYEQGWAEFRLWAGGGGNQYSPLARPPLQKGLK